MRRALLVVTLAVAASPSSNAARLGGTPVALVTAETENELVEVEVPDGRILGRLHLPDDPQNVVATNHLAVVVSTSAGAVTLVDPSPLRVVRVFRGFRSAAHPCGLAGWPLCLRDRRRPRAVGHNRPSAPADHVAPLHRPWRTPSGDQPRRKAHLGRARRARTHHRRRGRGASGEAAAARSHRPSRRRARPRVRPAGPPRVGDLRRSFEYRRLRRRDRATDAHDPGGLATTASCLRPVLERHARLRHERQRRHAPHRVASNRAHDPRRQDGTRHSTSRRAAASS